MSSHTVTLDLPEDMYRKAEQTAQAENRSIEEVLIGWLTRASEPFAALPSPFEDAVKALDTLAAAELIEVARRSLPPEDEEHLTALSSRHDQGILSEAEQNEIMRLASKQDEIAVLRARALQILRERGISLPDDLRAKLGLR